MIDSSGLPCKSAMANPYPRWGSPSAVMGATSLTLNCLYTTRIGSNLLPGRRTRLPDHSTAVAAALRSPRWLCRPAARGRDVRLCRAAAAPRARGVPARPRHLVAGILAATAGLVHDDGGELLQRSQAGPPPYPRRAVGEDVTSTAIIGYTLQPAPIVPSDLQPGPQTRRTKPVPIRLAHSRVKVIDLAQCRVDVCLPAHRDAEGRGASSPSPGENGCRCPVNSFRFSRLNSVVYRGLSC